MISAFRRQMQEDPEFKVLLSYVVSSRTTGLQETTLYLKKKKSQFPLKPDDSILRRIRQVRWQGI